MEALSPRDVNAQLRPKQPPQKSKLAPAPALKRAKDHPPPPPEEVCEPPSNDRPDGATYVTGRLLGKGGFAICHEGALSKTKEVFALKIVKSNMAQKKMEQKFQTELQIHSKMKHPNIVEFYRAFSYEESTYIVLELCPNGSLMDMTKKRKYLSEPEVRYYTIQIAGGIKYMHAKGIIHRDLKMGNIFLDSQMNCKIGDFGLAALLMSGKDMTAIRRTTLCGTPNYIAPEILEKGSQGHDNMVDIWSLGIIVFAMLTGQPPFASTKQEDIYRKAKNLDYGWPDRNDSDDAISEEVQDLVADLLQKAEDRPEPDTIVQHPFFTSGWFPTNEELTPVLREAPSNFPSISLRGSRSRLHISNYKEACMKCNVGPDAFKPKKIISTWKECALEEKAGLTPVVPLAAGIVYRPFVQWQREASESSLSRSSVERSATERSLERSLERSVQKEQSPPKKSASGLLSQPPLIPKAAPPKSFAAQQRAQHPGANAGTSIAGKVANKVRSLREESNQRLRQSGSTASAPAELNRGLTALPVRKSSSRLRNVQDANEENPAKRIRETNASVKERLAIDLAEQLSGSTLGKSDLESHFGPTDPVELISGTKPDYVLENVRSFRAELLRALESKAPIAHQRTSTSTPAVVVKWVDYTNKFGLGYILSNGSVGCMFKSMKASYSNTGAMTPVFCVVVKDAERHLQNRNNPLYKDRMKIVPMTGPMVEFYEKMDEGVLRLKANPRDFEFIHPGPPGPNGTPPKLTTGKNKYDNRRREKLMLWKKFANYMIANGDCKELAILGEPLDSIEIDPNDKQDASNVMLLYQRFGDVGCWLFGDGHYQFNFPDHTKLIISGDGTWCNFYHLPIDAAEKLRRHGDLPVGSLDDRQSLSYPIQTLLNFVSKPGRTKAPTRGRPPNTKPLEIDPSELGVPEANQFREKIEFIVRIVGEWIENGGVGNSAMDAEHRLRWTGPRQKVGVTEPYKHVWVTVGGSKGDERRCAMFDPYNPEDCVPDLACP